MSDPEEIEPLDPELARLFGAEKARPEEPPRSDRAERIFAAVLATIDLPPGGGGASGGTSGAPPSGVPSAGGAASGVAASGLSPFVVGALALTIGLGAGAALYAALGPERVIVREVRVEVPVPVPEEAVASRAEPESESVAIALPARIEEPSAPVHAPAPRRVRAPSRGASEPPAIEEPAETASATDADSLARESALLQRAQSALARRASNHAIAALREHETRFAEGQLREERDALWVSALMTAGDREAAAARARRFRARYPSSPLLPSIEAALGDP